MQKFSCMVCGKHVFDELDQLPTSSAAEPSKEALTVGTCLASLLTTCENPDCMHVDKYFLRLQTWMIQPHALAPCSTSEILSSGKRSGLLRCPGCTSELGSWSWDEYATCKSCKSFSTPVFSVRREAVSTGYECTRLRGCRHCCDCHPN